MFWNKTRQIQNLKNWFILLNEALPLVKKRAHDPKVKYQVDYLLDFSQNKGKKSVKIFTVVEGQKSFSKKGIINQLNEFSLLIKIVFNRIYEK